MGGRCRLQSADRDAAPQSSASEPSVLDTAAMQTVIRSTRGNTARVFALFGDLAAAAIGNGEERITPEAIEAWRPSVYDRTLAA